ncbi:hypothetical protein [Clostridium estertheticum]|uniref:hypothetical protein n=1 Tax=Clostridium estertheticum TaxID=238834 RepID=UPI001C0D5A95|nr:hypothetical protein [Clostridium estertheticum]MBU3173392.1 hypothetical protein [Clostridium estertheticum]
MRLNYDGKLIGTITTNHSMSIEFAIENLEVDTNKYSEIELFSIDYLDEYNVDAISKIYLGKAWKDISISEKAYFLNIIRPVNGETCNSATIGSCIIDFEGLSISIIGSIENEEIIINDKSTFYDPTA